MYVWSLLGCKVAWMAGWTKHAGTHKELYQTGMRNQHLVTNAVCSTTAPVVASSISVDERIDQWCKWDVQYNWFANLNLDKDSSQHTWILHLKAHTQVVLWCGHGCALGLLKSSTHGGIRTAITSPLSYTVYTSSQNKQWESPATCVTLPGSIRPLFGRTQYCFGAVVLTLKQIRFLDGLASFRSAVTTSVNGPMQQSKITTSKLSSISQSIQTETISIMSYVTYTT